MADYISREAVEQVLRGIANGLSVGETEALKTKGLKALYKIQGAKEILNSVDNDLCFIPAADVQPVNQCKMIPQNPDCRGYTDTFFCTNCQLHIHLGFIGQRYGGNYCIECGAEVEDGDTND